MLKSSNLRPSDEFKILYLLYQIFRSSSDFDREVARFDVFQKRVSGHLDFDNLLRFLNTLIGTGIKSLSDISMQQIKDFLAYPNPHKDTSLPNDQVIARIVYARILHSPGMRQRFQRTGIRKSDLNAFIREECPNMKFTLDNVISHLKTMPIRFVFVEE